MASSSDNISMAVFCDFENVALGVRDANYEKFDIKPVLERLLLKGSITVKKAYCDWDRYKGFKATMHEANFELIEIPHVRQSGKNSADIRLVVDALDLCYTKSHVNTFVIISGDSDFSPLVSKLRENNKQVIGVGVKQSTSDLLVANCDEFIFYDDLVREVRRAAAKRDERKAQPQQQANKRPSDENNKRKEELEGRKAQALEMVSETFDALVSERGDSGKIWASLLKDTLKRRRPDFSETYYGFRTFGNLLEEAQARGLLEFGRDEKSGAYVFRGQGTSAAAALEQMNGLGETAAPELAEELEQEAAPAEAKPDTRRGRGRGGRKGAGPRGEAQAQQAAFEQPELEQPEGEQLAAEQLQEPEEQLAQEQEPIEQVAALEAKPKTGRGRGRGGRSGGARGEAAAAQEPSAAYVAPEELQAFAPRRPAAETEPQAADEVAEAVQPEAVQEQPAPKERRRSARKTSYRTASVETPAEAAVPEPVEEVQAAPAEAEAYESPLGDLEMSDIEMDAEFNGNVAPGEERGTAARKRAPRSSAKPAARSRRPAKPKA
jgi:uncharacterized LabA/DUF88 family protein